MPRSFYILTTLSASLSRRDSSSWTFCGVMFETERLSCPSSFSTLPLRRFRSCRIQRLRSSSLRRPYRGARYAVLPVELSVGGCCSQLSPSASIFKKEVLKDSTASCRQSTLCSRVCLLISVSMMWVYRSLTEANRPSSNSSQLSADIYLYQLAAVHSGKGGSPSFRDRQVASQFLAIINLQMQDENDCQDPLWVNLDCLSVSDAIAEFVFIAICALFLAVAARRFLKSGQISSESSEEAQRKRNRLVHCGIIAFVLVYICSLVVAIVIYFGVRDDPSPMPAWKPAVLAFSLLVLLYVALLDLMYIAVAYMYCKAVISLGGIDEEHALDEREMDRRLRWAKVVLYIFAGLYIVTYGIGGVMLVESRVEASNNITSGTTLLCTSAISILFICFYRQAARHLQMSRSTKRTQQFRAAILVVASLLRSVVNLVNEWACSHLRKLEPPSCVEDSGPYTAYMAVYGVVANVLPVWVYLKMFEGWSEDNTVVKTVEHEHSSESRLID